MFNYVIDKRHYMKKNTVYYVSLGILLMMVAGCGGKSTVIPVGKGSVKGYVFAKTYNYDSSMTARREMHAATAGVPDGYTPIAGAKVEIVNLSSIAPVYTDSSGMFAFAGVYEGVHTIRVTKTDPTSGVNLMNPLEFTVTVARDRETVINDPNGDEIQAMQPTGAVGTLAVTAYADCTASQIPVEGDVYVRLEGSTVDKNTYVKTPAAVINDIAVGKYRVWVVAGADYEDAVWQNATITANVTTNLTFSLSPKNNVAPYAQIVTPADGASVTEGSTITMTGAAADCEDGAISDSRLSWTADGTRALGNGPTAQVSNLSVGTHTITLSATDNNGAVGSTSVTVTVLAAGSNRPPTASLISPAAGSTFAQGESITFIGAGMDNEDGVLTGSSLVWTSSIDKSAPIGTGLTFSKSDLSPGTHTITLTVKDSGGLTNSASEQIVISGTPAANQSPVAIIVTPVNGQTYTSGYNMYFRGAAVDAEDGNLSGSSLVWRVDGTLITNTGTGFFYTLTSGEHVILLTATDSQGASGTYTSTVTIQ